MRMILIGLALFGANAATAQQATPSSVIRVVGYGSVETPPDIANVSFQLRGEGATSDDAARALVSRRGAIEAALAGRARLRTGRLMISAARDKACDDDDRQATRLSNGPCAIKGYVATLGMIANITPLADAGTLLGLISRLGAVDPSLNRLDLSNPTAARRAAIDAAVRDARAQAEAIATASGVVLGRLRRVEDARAAHGNVEDIVVTALRRPPAPPVPITIGLSPAPITTTAELTVEFEVGGGTP